MTRLWDEIAHGVTTIITPQPWTAAAAIELMRTERVTVGQGVPTQWALVLAHPDFEGADLSHLRIAGTGAARVPPELVRDMRARLGCPVVVRYTSTETSLGTGTAPGDDVDVVATTVGRPVPGVDLEVVSDDGTPVAPGVVGRVRLRSGAAMRGYVGDLAAGVLIDEEATAAVIDAAGWVTTGDLGARGEDGNLRLAGREPEMYIRGGYNVYPAEVEAVLGEVPGVTQVAVVGAPDPVLGEIGVAFVTLESDATVDLDTLVSACRPAWPTTRPPTACAWWTSCPSPPWPRSTNVPWPAQPPCRGSPPDHTTSNRTTSKGAGEHMSETKSSEARPPRAALHRGRRRAHQAGVDAVHLGGATPGT